MIGLGIGKGGGEREIWSSHQEDSRQTGVRLTALHPRKKSTYPDMTKNPKGNPNFVPVSKSAG
jgi:hypothetical protein